MTTYPIIAASLAIFAKLDPVPFMPVEASTTARTVDFMMAIIMWVSAVFFVLIVGVTTYFVFKYRKGRAPIAEESGQHNMALEVSWTIIPLIIVMVIFYLGFKGYLDITTPPGNAYPITVNAQRWSWMFTYPNGYVDAELHVPVDRPVVLTMTSSDVIHSFFVPAFRVKKDVVPGRYTKAWFEATETGEFDVMCAEYCGAGHSTMLTKVVVHPPGEFEKWLADASNFVAKLAPADAGEKLYKVRGCAQCHTTDGSAHIGPTFKNIFGEQATLKDGTKVTVDENYIRESVFDPMKKVVAGFDPVMPTFQGKLTDKEIAALIEFIKSLSDEYRSSVLQAWPDIDDTKTKDKDAANAASKGAAGAQPQADGSGGDNGSTEGDKHAK